MLFDLAGVAGVEQKRAAMAAGEHINRTEDRAVMHYALRLPKDFPTPVYVDGENVIPQVHSVLDKVRYCSILQHQVVVLIALLASLDCGFHR